MADQEIEVEPGSHSVKLDRKSLRRGQEVTLAVVLDEPGDGKLSEQMELAGKLKHAGVIADDESTRPPCHDARNSIPT
jgi:hypothetical protein